MAVQHQHPPTRGGCSLWGLRPVCLPEHRTQLPFHHFSARTPHCTATRADVRHSTPVLGGLFWKPHRRRLGRVPGVTLERGPCEAALGFGPSLSGARGVVGERDSVPTRKPVLLAASGSGQSHLEATAASPGRHAKVRAAFSALFRVLSGSRTFDGTGPTCHVGISSRTRTSAADHSHQRRVQGTLSRAGRIASTADVHTLPKPLRPGEGARTPRLLPF